MTFDSLMIPSDNASKVVLMKLCLLFYFLMILIKKTKKKQNKKQQDKSGFEANSSSEWFSFQQSIG